MKFFKSLSVFLILILLFSFYCVPAAYALEYPEITANAAVLIDRDTGTVFYAKNENERVYPASTTKIMTVLLAVEAINAGTVSATDEVTCGEGLSIGIDADSSRAGLQIGEVLTLQSLLYLTLTQSAGDACNAVAEYIGGSVSNFVSMMNARASELGCTGTNFTNTHGMPDDNHYTTAMDMYLVALEAMNHELFQEICGTRSIEIPATNMAEARILTTTNALINTQSEYYYSRASGIKTGYTSAAGYCLVSCAEVDDIMLFAVVMGSTKSGGQFSDSITLFDWGFENFSYREILTSSEIVAEVPVEMASDADSVTLRPENSIRALLANDDDLSGVKKEITIYSERAGTTLEAPIESGDVLGEITVSINGVTYGTTKLVASKSIALSSAQYIKNEIGSTWSNPKVKLSFWVIILLICAYLAVVVRYMILRRRHKQSVRAAINMRDAQRRNKQIPVPPANYPDDKTYDTQRVNIDPGPNLVYEPESEPQPEPEHVKEPEPVPETEIKQRSEQQQKFFDSYFDDIVAEGDTSGTGDDFIETLKNARDVKFDDDFFDDYFKKDK